MSLFNSLLKHRTTAILVGGFIAGTLDATAAVIHLLLAGGKEPIMIFRYIASGVFGQDAFTDGIGMAAMGLFFHYCIATIWTTVYFVLYRQIVRFSRRPMVNGLLYGPIVWTIMNFVVLPLSHVTQFPLRLDRALIGIGILMVCIGLPIAWIAKRYFTRPSTDPTISTTTPPAM